MEEEEKRRNDGERKKKKKEEKKIHKYLFDECCDFLLESLLQNGKPVNVVSFVEIGIHSAQMGCLSVWQ